MSTSEVRHVDRFQRLLGQVPPPRRRDPKDLFEAGRRRHRRKRSALMVGGAATAGLAAVAILASLPQSEPQVPFIDSTGVASEEPDPAVHIDDVPAGVPSAEQRRAANVDPRTPEQRAAEEQRRRELEQEELARFFTDQEVVLDEAGPQRWVSEPVPLDIDEIRNFIFEFRVVGGEAYIDDVDVTLEQHEGGTVMIVSYDVVVPDSDSVLQLIRGAASAS